MSDYKQIYDHNIKCRIIRISITEVIFKFSSGFNNNATIYFPELLFTIYRCKASLTVYDIYPFLIPSQNIISKVHFLLKRSSFQTKADNLPFVIFGA